jgi:hypothetical protein
MPTVEEMRKYKEKHKKEREEFNKYLEELRFKELESKGLKPFDESRIPKKYCDHPNTMENSTATALWIVVMLVGSIFKGNWVIWIIATVLWAKFITRHDK